MKEQRAISFCVMFPCLASLLLCARALSEVTIQNAKMTFVLNDDATWQSLIDKAHGRECVADAGSVSMASVTHNGKTFQANYANLAGDTLVVGFANTDTVITYRIETSEDWIIFRIQSIRGTRPERVVFLRVPVGITEKVGRRLNIAWDEHTAVCVMAANRQADCGATKGKHADLVAATQDSPGPAIEGAAAALIVCPTPQFKPIARRASHAFGLLTNEAADGTPVKDTDLPRGSYWFLSVGERDVDKVIELCDRTGFKQVMIGSGSWCKTVGHYTFNEERYPNGMEGLKAVVDKLHAHGILVGMHTFASKVSKTDPYVTPVPDRRFWKDMETKLAEDATAEATEIRAAGDLSQWPGSPLCKQKVWEGGVTKHQEVVIGDEIIQYQTIGPEGKWDTFLGCKRGAWGTRAAPHRAGEPAYHFAVDGCINGYIIDQETDLMDEVAERLAHIFNYCGFDMIYFDGGEDVDRRRFNYYVSNFQEQVMRRIKKRPIIHMGTIMTHLLWHSFARSSTVDTYLSTLYGAITAGAPPDRWPTVKEHIDRSVAYMLSVNEDMMPGELGWFGIWPKGKDTDGLQLDEVEYLMCKSLTYDAPISLQTSFSEMEAHVLTPEILRIVQRYENIRMAKAASANIASMLREPRKDFALLPLPGGDRWEPVAEVPLESALGLRAFVGGLNGGSFAILWHSVRDGFVLLPVEPRKVSLWDFSGKALNFTAEGQKALIPVGPWRCTLICEATTVDELIGALQRSQLRLRKPIMIFIQAEDCKKLEGEMARGSQVGVTDPEAFGDVIVCTGMPSPNERKEWYAEYTVDLPHDGRWTIWARVKYPSATDHSFGFVPAGETVTLSGDQVLGNCGVNEGKWHWTGRGGGSTAVPPGAPITLNLKKGPFTFRIYAREGSGTAATNPRLDVLCITDEALEPPTDEEAAALHK